MSNSQGNALALSATEDTICSAVRRVYTDPDHLHVTDPGWVEGNIVFTYLDAFDPDRGAVAELKADYSHGGLGDTAVKRRHKTVLCDRLAPIRARRATWEDRPDDVSEIQRDGTGRAHDVTQAPLEAVEDALGLCRLRQ